MSMFLPVLMVGALASAAWAMESPESAIHAAPGKATAPTVVPMDPKAETPGLGAYLIGAVADLGGSPTVALGGYLRALGDDPDNMELRQRTFELALMAGDMPNAVRLARTIPEVEQSAMTRLVRMADDAKAGRVDAARREAREIEKVSPELLQFRLLQIYLDYGRGKRVEDLVAWLDSLPLPQSMSGRRAYHEARLWLKNGETEKGLAALAAAHKAEPNAVVTTVLLGQLLARQGEPGAAAAIYDSFRAANPAVALLVPAGKDVLDSQPPAFASTLSDDLGATLSDFGLLVWSQGALGPARQVLNLSIWLNPEDIYTRYYNALLLEMGNDLGAAQAHYEALLNPKVPDHVQLAAKIRLAEIKFRLGQEDEAWNDLKQLAEANPGVASLQRSVAQLAFSRGEYKDAAKYYGALIERLPEGTPPEAISELFFARGAAHERAGDVKAATDDLQAALKLTPTEPQVMNYLGYMWVDNGMNIEEAFALLQKAHLLEPQDGAITDSLGWAYYRQGDYATAMTYLVMATEQDPESPEIYDHLGDAYAKLGRMEDARREWQRALDLLAAGKVGPGEGFERTVRKKLKR